VEFAAKLPPNYKVQGLDEKYILKKALGHLLPQRITKRNKQPYRAPMASCFFQTNGKAGNEIMDLIHSGNQGLQTEYFNQKALENFWAKWQRKQGQLMSERENIAFVILLSTLALDRLFISNRNWQESETNQPIKIVFAKKNP
jgi:asparagine synthase (glutamine-hydrolysing)